MYCIYKCKLMELRGITCLNLLFLAFVGFQDSVVHRFQFCWVVRRSWFQMFITFFTMADPVKHVNQNADQHPAEESPPRLVLEQRHQDYIEHDAQTRDERHKRHLEYGGNNLINNFKISFISLGACKFIVLVCVRFVYEL